MPATPDWTNTVLPVLLASVSAFVAIESLMQARNEQEQPAQGLLAATSLGLAVWLTGIYGIQARRGPTVRFYDELLILASLATTFTLVWVGLRLIGRNPANPWLRYAAPPTLVSLAVSATNLFNISALHLAPRFQWHAGTMLYSFLLGTLLIFLAIRVFTSGAATLPRRAFGALFLGCTIYGMHASTMHAIVFATGTRSVPEPWSTRGFVLVRLGTSAFVFLATALLVYSYERSSRWMRLAHEAQQAAHDSTEKAERLATAGKLAACIAHEINNPLEAVGNLLYLVGINDLPQDAREYLSQAQSELQRIAEITTHTLKFYKQQHAPEVVNVVELFDTALALFAPRLQRSGIQVEKCWLSDPPPLLCRAGEIRQILANLVSNAIDAMPEGGRLQLGLERRGDDLEISVADTGSGIPAEMQSKIFEPFFTTKGLRGTGLGLFLCMEIVTRHSGSMRVQSETRSGASGTTFWVRLPYAQPAERVTDQTGSNTVTSTHRIRKDHIARLIGQHC